MEFAVVAPFLVTMLLGVVGVGFTLSRSIQTNQVTRDVGHMFFDGVDLSQRVNQKVVGRLAYGMGMASDNQGTIDTNGNGVVILTQIIKVGAIECNNGGYSTTGTCPNYNQLVIEKRIVIGNATLRTSAFGTPTGSLLQSDGSILPHDFCTDPSVVVSGTSTASNLNLSAGQYSFVTESYFTTPSLSGFLAHQDYSYAMM